MFKVTSSNTLDAELNKNVHSDICKINIWSSESQLAQTDKHDMVNFNQQYNIYTQLKM